MSMRKTLSVEQESGGSTKGDGAFGFTAITAISVRDDLECAARTFRFELPAGTVTRSRIFLQFQ